MTRIPALDRLRGVLALLVVLEHEAQVVGSHWLDLVGALCVLAFFALSGYVLALSYDRRPLSFLVRRFVRLWPSYALSVAAGFVLLAQPPDVGMLFWLPDTFDQILKVNRPGWSLYIEVWACPALLALFWMARHGRLASCATLAGAGALIFARPSVPLPYIFLSFAIGVFLTHYPVRWPSATPRLSMWLGKISYSLYISHWVVIHAVIRWLGPAWMPATIPLVFLIAWAMWRWVEQPSVRLSRWITAPRLRVIEQNSDATSVSVSDISRP